MTNIMIYVICFLYLRLQNVCNLLMKTAYELNGMEKTLGTFFSSGKQKYNIIIECELCVLDLFFALLHNLFLLI